MNGFLSYFYYITHIDNVKSILEKGILSHNQVEKRGITPTKIYDKGVLARRHKKYRDYANLYFNPRNPMLFRLIKEKGENSLAIIAVNNQVVKEADVLLADGNVASSRTRVQPFSKIFLSQIKKQVGIDSWTNYSDERRKIMAEVLVPTKVKKEYIHKVCLLSKEAYDIVKKQGGGGVVLDIEEQLKFDPGLRTKISENLELIEGDMFFSHLQTLTITVNTVGAMGKGLASCLKSSYHNIYIKYRELCKRGKLKIGKPYLIKTNYPFYTNLVDCESSALREKYVNSTRYFLMFPTKKHWKYPSKLQYVEDGLKWLRDDIQDKDDIQSIALPALGCGLGNLSWKDVGPLMGKYLHDLNKKVEIYLPAEGVKDEYRTSNFLLSQVKN